MLTGAGLARAAACDGGALDFEPLAPDLWLLRAPPADADPVNRGVVSNLVLARESQRWWLLGSGPSAAFGRRLGCEIRRQFAAELGDVVSPWARPELVLGLAGLPAARHWAHAEVAEAMRVQCSACVERLRARLGGAATDLGDQEVVLPGHLMRGTQGRLGPFEWWLLPRAPGRWVTVWRHQSGPAPALWIGHGLLAAAVPGDGRDADLFMLRDSLLRLQELARSDGPGVRWIGEQGGVLPADAPALQARYWTELIAAARRAIDLGADESAAPPALAGWGDAVRSHPWHALNWQRAWRQVESREFAPAASSPASR